MKPRHLTDWSFLGSALWLRPVRPDDLIRLEAFLGRSDLAGNADRGRLSPFSLRRLLGNGRGKRRYSARHGISLVAVDPLGAPAGLFALVPESVPGTGLVLFEVPRDDLGVFREGLRLLADAARLRTRLECLAIRGVSDASDIEAVLSGVGWERLEPGVWVRSLRRRASNPTQEAFHAG